MNAYTFNVFNGCPRSPKKRFLSLYKMTSFPSYTTAAAYAAAGITSFDLNFGLHATVDDDLVFIDGKTYESKDKLRALGAKWIPELKTWMIASDTDLTPLLRPSSAAPVAATVAPAPAAMGGAGGGAEPGKKRTLKRSLKREVLDFDLKAIFDVDAIYVKGETYANMDRLKKLGGVWNTHEKAYVFPPDFDLTPLREPAGVHCALDFALRAISGKDAVYVKGALFENNARLKALGGAYKKDLNAYVFPADFDLAPLKIRPDVKPTPIPVPTPRPWWFCGHERARITNLHKMYHDCPDCPSSLYYKDTLGYTSYVRGSLYTGD
jgi:hypothetical protein